LGSIHFQMAEIWPSDRARLIDTKGCASVKHIYFGMALTDFTSARYLGLNNVRRALGPGNYTRGPLFSGRINSNRFRNTKTIG
jgi:hypothetical protein